MSIGDRAPSPFVAQFLSEDVMTRSTRRILLGLVFAATFASVAGPLLAQSGGGTMTPQEQPDVRWDREKELQSLAVVERKVMIPMRDGVRLATDIYRPKDAAGKVPDRSSCGRPTTSTSGTCATACPPT